MQQQSCPKCIKGVVRQRMRSLIGKLMALPPLLLTPEGIQAAVHGAPRDRGEAVSVQTLFGKIALDGVKIADCRNMLLALLGLKSKEALRKNYLGPALEFGLVIMSNPDKPTSRNQTYIKK